VSRWIKIKNPALKLWAAKTCLKKEVRVDKIVEHLDKPAIVARLTEVLQTWPLYRDLRYGLADSYTRDSSSFRGQCCTRDLGILTSSCFQLEFLLT
jgi:hypothetical protein